MSNWSQIPSTRSRATLLIATVLLSVYGSIGTAAVIEGPSGGIQAEVIRGEAASVDLPLTNTSVDASGPLSISIPATLNWLVVDGPNPIPPIGGGQSATVTLVGTVPNSIPLGVINTSFSIYEAGSGTPFSVAAEITVSAPPSPGAEIETPAGGIQEEVEQGAAVSIDFELTNTGPSASQPISLAIPSTLDWLSVGSAHPIPSILAGKSALVQLVGTVPANTPTGVTSATLVALEDGAGHHVAIPAQITVSPPAGTAILEVFVEDEGTYFEPGFPKVAGATVELLDPVSGHLLEAATSDAAGRAEFSDLAAGSYILRVSAPAHTPEQQVVSVVAGATLTQTVFIPRSDVGYTPSRWK